MTEKLKPFQHRKFEVRCALERKKYESEPFLLLESGRLWIKTKAGTLERFVLNSVQQKLHRIIKNMWADNQIIRINLLKARQMGMSTYIEALLYCIVSTQPNTNACIIADKQGNSAELFEKLKLYHEKLKDPSKPQRKRSNKITLEFDKLLSQIDIESAENKRAGQSRTYRLVHKSEKAYFPYPDDTDLALTQTVPDLPRTIIIDESTANGYNRFQQRWEEAKDEKSIWKNIFFPWFEMDEYRMDPPKDFKLLDYLEYNGQRIKVDEGVLKARHKLTDDQVYWYRWVLINKCGADLRKRSQEYPSSPEEAFVASGNCYFDVDALKRQLDTKPKYLQGKIVGHDTALEFLEHASGSLKIFKQPVSGFQYFIGADTAEGINGDYSVAQVIEGKSGSIVATYRANIDPDLFAINISKLGIYYNMAKLGVENNFHGFSVNSDLRMNYPNLYYQEVMDQTSNTVTKKFGWTTNKKTKPLMLDESKECIREGSLDLRDEVTIKEHLTFFTDEETGKAEAQPGYHDDCVIATAIAVMMRKMFYVPSKEPHYREFGGDYRRRVMETADQFEGAY